MTTSMTAHRTQATVQSDGTLTISGLPIAPGQNVEVIVFLPQTAERPSMQDVLQRLRGSVTQFDDPFSPAVPPEDWEANR
jgi:hypothetical protein